MTGLTDFITERCWEDVIICWFVLIDDAYQTLERAHGPLRPHRRGPAPRLSDSEILTLSVLIDTYFDGDEALGLACLRQHYRHLFPHLTPSNGHFNRRRQVLRAVHEQIRQHLLKHWQLIDPQDDTRLIDSAPIPICVYARARRNTTAVGLEYCSVMPSRQAKLYGFRFHTVSGVNQVIEQWALAPAAVHDSQVMPALLEDYRSGQVFGDHAYHSPLQEPFLARRELQVWAPPRRDMRQQWPKAFRRLSNYLRRHLETALSVLVMTFQLARPGSRSLTGLVTRMSSRVLAHTLCFITNQHFLPQLALITPK